MRQVLWSGMILLCLASVSAGAESTTHRPDVEYPLPVTEFVAPAQLDEETSIALRAELDARIEAGQKEAKKLNQKALTALGAERIGLQRQIQEGNEALYLDLLRIQARHTRAAGFTEAAQQIEATITARIEARRDPSARVSVQKVERPLPVVAGGDQ